MEAEAAAPLMVGNVIDGKAVAAKIRLELAVKVKELKDKCGKVGPFLALCPSPLGVLLQSKSQPHMIVFLLAQISSSAGTYAYRMAVRMI